MYNSHFTQHTTNMTKIEQEYPQSPNEQFNEMRTQLDTINSWLNTTTVLSILIPLLSPYIPIDVFQRNVKDLYTYGFLTALGSIGALKIINSEALAQFLFSQEFSDRE